MSSTISQLPPATALNGAELVPAVQRGVNVRLTAGQIAQLGGGGGGTPASPVTSIQYNNSGSFGGDANLVWLPGAGGLVAKDRGSFGTFASAGGWTQSPGDPAKSFFVANTQAPLVVNSYISGALSGLDMNPVQVSVGYKNTSGSNANCFGISNISTINSDSIGPWGSFWGGNFQPLNYSSAPIDYFAGAFISPQNNAPSASNINWLIGVDTNSHHGGSGTLNFGVGVWAEATASNGTTLEIAGLRCDWASAGTAIITAGRTIEVMAPVLSGSSTASDVVGVYIEDHSGKGSTRSWNIWSQGDSSITQFDGLHVRKPRTVSSLPPATATLNGAQAFVTDATSAVFASVVAGSGTNRVPVYCDGSSWRVG